MAIKDTLDKLMTDSETSGYLLSEKTGVPQPTIHRILTGKSIDPKTDTLKPIAKYFGITVSQLRDGEVSGGNSKLSLVRTRKTAAEIQPVPAGDNYAISKPFPEVPLISWVVAGAMKDIDVLPDPDVGDWPMLQPTFKLGKRGWALTVEGDSMDDGTSRAIRAGEILFCDPDVGADANHLVIAKHVGMQRATFKQLITEDGKWYLKAWNKDADFGVNGRLEIDDPELRVIARVMRIRYPDRPC